MKYFIFFALLGLAASVYALPASNVRRSTSDVQSRELWADENLQERALDDILFDSRFLDSDFELGERDYQDIESRKIRASNGFGQGHSNQEILEHNKQLRESFARNTVRRFKDQFPQYNWMACHVKHTTDFKGKQGTDWGHSHQELELEKSGSIGYEIYWFREGTFRRQGDGGYINWAYIGKVQSTGNNGATVVFGRP